MSDFSQKLISIIKYRGLTQKDLADKLDITPSTLNGYVRGTRQPDFDTLKNLSKALNCTISYLFDTDIVENDLLFDALDKKGIDDLDASEILKIPLCIFDGFANGQLMLNEKDVSNISEFLRIPVDQLLGREEKMPSNAMPIGKMINMSVIGSISAGYDGIAIEDIIDEYPVIEKAFRGYYPDECFVLRIKGNSMFPSFHDGDYVLVHKQQSVDSGEIAIVLYNGDEATIKKVEYKQGEKWMRLVPHNPEYMTKTIKDADLEECRVLGKVVSLVYRSID